MARAASAAPRGACWNPHDVAYTPLAGTDGAPIGLVMYDDPASGVRPDEEAFRYIEFFADTAARVIEQIRTTERLRRTEYRLAALLESMPDVVFYEGGERAQLISRNLQALLGVAAEEVERSPEGLFGLLDPRDSARIRAKQAQWEREGARGTLITRARMRTAEGGFRWIEDRAVRLPGHGREGGPTRAGVMIDVTEQVRTEEALREREQRFHMVTLATRDAIYDWNVTTGFVWRNEALADILGEPADSPDVSWWRDRIEAEDRGRVEASLAAAMQGGERNWEAEYRLRVANGGYAHVQDRGFIVRDEQGQAVRLIGAMSDITGRKRAEQRQALMLRELDHRVKNNLASVMVLAEQSLRVAPTLQHFERAFSGRLRALARTHGVLAQSHWRAASLEGIVRQTLEPYTIDDERRLVVDGQEQHLPARMAAPLALALNELATNAVKYGALSAAAGWVGVAWRRVDDPEFGNALRLEWSEHGGPRVSAPPLPGESGFGTKLIADEVQFQLRGRAEMSFDPDGVRCVIVAPLDGPGQGEPTAPPGA
jgi:PAS domain S-box-containing protein